MTLRSRSLFTTLWIVVVTLPLVTMAIILLMFTRGHFTYSLDDAYIHLSLARNIFHGQYGINSFESSSPSSSILWPVLLSPFSVLGSCFKYVPLVINIVSFLATSYFITQIFKPLGLGPALLVTLSIVFGLNHYGLVFTGMEHNLHVLLVSIVAYGILVFNHDDVWLRIRPLVFVALTVMPLIRYEGFAITIPAYIFLFNPREKQAIFVSALIALSSVIGFSIFLYQLGLDLLPASIQVKNFNSIPIYSNWRSNLSAYGPIWVAIMVFCYTLLKSNIRLSLTIFLTSVLHFSLGQSGWAGRYEVYYFTFVLLLILKTLLSANPKQYWLVILLPVAFLELVKVTISTPSIARFIYNQHNVMAEIAQDLDGAIALNDIGAVSFFSHRTILDLAGLSSPDVAHARMSGEFNSDFIEKLMGTYQASYAMVSNYAVPDKPQSWIKIGALRTNMPVRWIVDADVEFFAVSKESARRFYSVLKEFKYRQSAAGYNIILAEPAP